MKKLLIVFALLCIPSLAWAQCSGVFPNNTVCGNATGASNTPRVTSPAAFLGAAGGTNGQIQFNNAGALGGFTASGDCTVVTSTGVFTCIKTNGVSFGPFATDNATATTAALNLFTTSLQGLVPSSGGGIAKYLRADGTFTAPCPLGWFCVSQFANPAAAVAALNSAGGGTLYFDVSVTVSSPLVITVPVTIRCASTGVKIGTSSTTTDLFTLSGSPHTIRDCNLAYTGGSTKTAGYLINSTGNVGTFDNVQIDGNCWQCINTAGIVKIVSNSTINANTIAVSGSSGGIVTSAEILHLSNTTIGSGPTNPYNFGLLVNQGAVDGVNLEILEEQNPIRIAPTTGVAAFLKLATSYLDNCAATCVLLQTQGGSIGYVEINSTEFGSDATTASVIQIDTATGGGNIGPVTINNSNIFSYIANSGNGVILVGSLGSVIISNTQIGSNLATGFATFGAATATLNLNNNVFTPTTAAIAFGAAQTSPVIIGNRYGGKTVGLAGSSTTFVVNNVP